MPSLDNLAPIVCVLCWKSDITIHIDACTLNYSCVKNVHEQTHWPWLQVVPTKTLLVPHWTKFWLISLAHGLCQHHMVIWNSLLLHALTPLLILSSLQGSLKNLATTLLHALSIPGSHGILCQCKSSMTMEESSLVFPYSRFYSCWIKSQFQPQKNPQPNVIYKQMHETVATVLETLLFAQPSQTICEATLLVDDVLAIAMHAFHSKLQLHCKSCLEDLHSGDMFLNIPLLTYKNVILEHREWLVNYALICTNKRHINLTTGLIKSPQVWQNTKRQI